jgi:chromosome segregation ATPase
VHGTSLRGRMFHFFTRRSNRVAPCVDEVASAPSAEALGLVRGEARSFEFRPPDEAQVLNAELILSQVRVQGLAEANSKLAEKLAEAEARIEAMEKDRAALQTNADERVEVVRREKAALQADFAARDKACATEKAALAAELAKRTAEMATLTADRARALENVRQLSYAQDLREEARVAATWFARATNRFRMSRAELVRENTAYARDLERTRKDLEVANRKVGMCDSTIQQMGSDLQSMRHPDYTWRWYRAS